MILDTDSQPNNNDLRPSRPNVVMHAIVGMWLSVLFGQGVNVMQAFYGSNRLDFGAIIFSCVILAGALLVHRQISAAREWARMAFLLLLVLSYSLMALDDAGFTGLDLIGLLLTIPVNLYVLARLYGARASLWFLGPDSKSFE